MQKKPVFWESLGVSALADPTSNSRQLLGTLHLQLMSVSIARVFLGYVLRMVASSHREELG